MFIGVNQSGVPATIHTERTLNTAEVGVLNLAINYVQLFEGLINTRNIAKSIISTLVDLTNVQMSEEQEKIDRARSTGVSLTNKSLTTLQEFSNLSDLLHEKIKELSNIDNEATVEVSFREISQNIKIIGNIYRSISMMIETSTPNASDIIHSRNNYEKEVRSCAEQVSFILDKLTAMSLLVSKVPMPASATVGTLATGEIDNEILNLFKQIFALVPEIRKPLVHTSELSTTIKEIQECCIKCIYTTEKNTLIQTVKEFKEYIQQINIDDPLVSNIKTHIIDYNTSEKTSKDLLAFARAVKAVLLE